MPSVSLRSLLVALGIGCIAAAIGWHLTAYLFEKLTVGSNIVQSEKLPALTLDNIQMMPAIKPADQSWYLESPKANDMVSSFLAVPTRPLARGCERLYAIVRSASTSNILDWNDASPAYCTLLQSRPWRGSRYRDPDSFAASTFFHVSAAPSGALRTMRVKVSAHKSLENQSHQAQLEFAIATLSSAFGAPLETIISQINFDDVTDRGTINRIRYRFLREEGEYHRTNLVITYPNYEPTRKFVKGKSDRGPKNNVVRGRRSTTPEPATGNRR